MVITAADTGGTAATTTSQTEYNDDSYETFWEYDYGATNYSDDEYNYTYSSDYSYDDDDHTFVYYKTFDFEKPIYLYVWETLVLLTTIANVLVMVILLRRSMRNSTNAILVAIAVSDSLTGIATLPAYMYAYGQFENTDLKLTKSWCRAFMLSKFFVSKSFHMISIWLTVLLGFQRFISVTFPFKAQSMFTIPKILAIIAVTCCIAPLLHVYHLTDSKVNGLFCYWEIEEPCRQSCVYLWATFIFMYFVPCVLLLAFTFLMIRTMHKTTNKMKLSHLISSQQNLKRRSAESRRISVIVVAVVIIFLIPEVPYAVFLVISVSLTHARTALLDLRINRAIHCAYELLLVCSFHANFWVYLIMNRKFRLGIQQLLEPVMVLLYAAVGADRRLRRRGSDASSYVRTLNSALPAQPEVEMKTYRADINSGHVDRQLALAR